MKERFRALAMKAGLAVIFAHCLLGFSTRLLPRDSSGTTDENDVFVIAIFPNEEVSAEQWLKDSGWNELRGSLDFFMIKDGCLLMQNTNASTSIGLEFETKIDPRKYPIIEFRARIDEIPLSANVTDKEKDDSAFRLFVLFDKGGWLLSPPQTIGYVWDSTRKSGTTGRSESFGKVRYIVIGSGREGLGEWRDYERNILNDYELLFGSADVPKIAAIGLKCDSNHTAGYAASAIRWIRLRAAKKASK